ncbi:ssDNA endodeoxyribonuclease [Podila epigama]|nr:ssDNA endodeoxyribonuclease [Podila epigama]
MSQIPNECTFNARLRNVKHLATLIKSVHFKDRTVFEEYRYISPISEDNADAPLPSGYDEDGSVTFGINLSTMLSCLNMFGTANVGTTGADSTASSTGVSSSHSAFSASGSGSITGVKLSYNGIGSKFTLILEDNGVVTRCGIPTVDPDTPVLFDFNDELNSKVIMKSMWLEEGLRDLDATSEKVVLRFSSEIPHFRISSLGTIENLDVNYSKGDVIETFVYPYNRPLEVSYNFSHVLYVLRASSLATTVNIMVDDKDFLKMQFLIQLPEHKFLFTEYAFCPLEAME